MSYWVILVVFVAATIAGSPVAASAHPDQSGMFTLVTTPAPPLLASLGTSSQAVLTRGQPATMDAMTLGITGLGLAGALATSRRRGRHLLAIGTSLVLVLVGYAGAVHSVHHLGDSQGADRCVLAASAEHVNGMDSETAPLAAAAAVAVGRACADPPDCVRDASLAPTRGRAPPA
jgi:hypothetical protein